MGRAWPEKAILSGFVGAQSPENIGEQLLLARDHSLDHPRCVIAGALALLIGTQDSFPVAIIGGVHKLAPACEDVRDEKNPEGGAVGAHPPEEPPAQIGGLLAVKPRKVGRLDLGEEESGVPVSECLAVAGDEVFRRSRLQFIILPKDGEPEGLQIKIGEGRQLGGGGAVARGGCGRAQEKRVADQGAEKEAGDLGRQREARRRGAGMEDRCRGTDGTRVDGNGRGCFNIAETMVIDDLKNLGSFKAPDALSAFAMIDQTEKGLRRVEQGVGGDRPDEPPRVVDNKNPEGLGADLPFQNGEIGLRGNGDKFGFESGRAG